MAAFEGVFQAHDWRTVQTQVFPGRSGSSRDAKALCLLQHTPKALIRRHAHCSISVQERQPPTFSC